MAGIADDARQARNLHRPQTGYSEDARFDWRVTQRLLLSVFLSDKSPA
jgi:hypothetical protein